MASTTLSAGSSSNSPVGWGLPVVVERASVRPGSCRRRRRRWWTASAAGRPPRSASSTSTGVRPASAPGCGGRPPACRWRRAAGRCGRRPSRCCRRRRPRPCRPSCGRSPVGHVAQHAERVEDAGRVAGREVGALATVGRRCRGTPRRTRRLAQLGLEVVAPGVSSSSVMPMLDEPRDLERRARRAAAGRPGCRSASCRRPGRRRRGRSPRGRAGAGGTRRTARPGRRRPRAPAGPVGAAVDADRPALRAAPRRRGTARPS